LPNFAVFDWKEMKQMMQYTIRNNVLCGLLSVYSPKVNVSVVLSAKKSTHDNQSREKHEEISTEAALLSIWLCKR
jgi:hypothetical protein